MVDKKEMIRKYKQTLPEMGVYQIRNLKNGKVFIGSAKDVKGIINSNRFQLRIGRHFNDELQRDFNSHGEEQFSFEVIDTFKPKEDPAYDYTEDLHVLETMWQEKRKKETENPALISMALISDPGLCKEFRFCRSSGFPPDSCLLSPVSFL